MRKYLSLTLLVFLAFIFTLSTYAISVKTPLIDHEACSDTNESIKIDTKNTLINTKDLNLTQNSLNSNQQNIEKINFNSNTTDNLTQYKFLRYSEDISIENLKIAENEISKLPYNLIETFNNKNCSIQISNENISSKYFNNLYNNVIGVTLTNSKQIIVENKKSSISKSISHEFGHFLDWYFKFPSMSQEFKEIYTEEINTFKEKIPNASCVRNSTEFFAHTFYYYIKDQSKCTPKALKFIKNYLNYI